MKRMLMLLTLIPAAALAKDPFEGTWKTRIDSMKFSGAPDVYELKDGSFACKSCAPAYTVKADGAMQQTPENPYRDRVSFRITGPSSAEWTVQKSGKTFASTKLVVSADGKTLTDTTTNYQGATPTTTTTVEKRLAPGSAGSHPIAGSWQNERVTDASAAGLVGTITATPNGLKFDFNGMTVDAKFDGKEYPTVGDPGHTMVTLKRISEYEIEETDRRGGAVTDVTHWKAASDGKSISLVDEDKAHGTTTSFLMDRQK